MGQENSPSREPAAVTGARRANSPHVLSVLPKFCTSDQTEILLLLGLADYAHKELSALEKNIWDSSRAQLMHIGRAEPPRLLEGLKPARVPCSQVGFSMA